MSGTLQEDVVPSPSHLGTYGSGRGSIYTRKRVGGERGVNLPSDSRNLELAPMLDGMLSLVGERILHTPPPTEMES